MSPGKQIPFMLDPLLQDPKPSDAEDFHGEFWIRDAVVAGTTEVYRGDPRASM